MRMNSRVNIEVTVENERTKCAEEILAEIGLDLDTAMNMFIHQIVFHNGLPFKAEIPAWVSTELMNNVEYIDISNRSEE